MRTHSLNRRQFLHTGALAVASAASIHPSRAAAAEKPQGVSWPIGCFNRPWGTWSFDAALDGLKTAGFRLMGILGNHKGELLLNPEATPDYLDALRERIAARGLTPNLGWAPTRLHPQLSDSIRFARELIDQAARLKLTHLLTAGVSRENQYEDYYRTMAAAAAYAQDKGIKLVIKPHGGCCAASAELLRCLEKVNHPNFKIWYDAGNILHYTGKDPVAELEPIAKHVTGFCAKDCAAEKGQVMIQFGDGKVDFKAVFAKLKAAGFDGPIMIECCAVGATAAEVTANAGANRKFLERTLAAI